MGKLLFYHLPRSWKIKNVTSSYQFKKWKNKILISKSLKIFFIEILYNSELFEKNAGMLDVVILDIDLAFNRYCLWSCHEITQYIHSDMLLCFLKKAFVIRLFCCY